MSSPKLPVVGVPLTPEQREELRNNPYDRPNAGIERRNPDAIPRNTKSRRRRIRISN